MLQKVSNNTGILNPDDFFELAERVDKAPKGPWALRDGVIVSGDGTPVSNADLELAVEVYNMAMNSYITIGFLINALQGGQVKAHFVDKIPTPEEAQKMADEFRQPQSHFVGPRGQA